jgi:hypothetical protein
MLPTTDAKSGPGAQPTDRRSSALVEGTSQTVVNRTDATTAITGGGTVER